VTDEAALQVATPNGRRTREMGRWEPLQHLLVMAEEA
jgi:hypothetical protein